MESKKLTLVNEVDTGSTQEDFERGETTPQRRPFGRLSSYEKQFKKTELDSIAASEVLVLATAIALSVTTGLELRERRKDRRTLILTAITLATFIGLARLAFRLLTP